MRQYLVMIPLLIIGLLGAFFGCSREIKGPPRVNIKPIVNFVNIPVEGALFSSDTLIWWYGTDVDGFIDSFYYAVVEASIVGANPDDYISAGNLDPESPDWIGIKVELDNTGTNAQVQMSADVSDPVRKYITSYVFLVAVDNLGMRSDVVFRSYAKNNHFPNTTVTVQGFRDPYINAKTEYGILEGVTIDFSATDNIDYPRNPPPFEYRWKIYGPFTDSLYDVVRANYIGSTFVDLYGDFYQKGDTIKYYNRLDTLYIDEDTVITDTVWNEFLADNLIGGNPYGVWQEALLGIDTLTDKKVLDPSDYYILDTLTILQNYFVDSSGWSFESRANVFDLFAKQVLDPSEDTTRLMRFLVWGQTRDDAHVPDPVADFRFFSVIEPKFERDVVLVDATSYERPSSHNWPIFPRDPWKIPVYPDFPDTSGPALRDVLGGFINSWKPGSFDVSNILPNDTICPDCCPDCGTSFLWVIRKWRNGATQDYYPIRAIDAFTDSGYSAIDLREVLKHKIALIVKDNTANPVGFESTDGLAIIDGINAGMNAWLMARAAAGEGQLSTNNVPDIDNILTTYFGVLALQQTGWQEKTYSNHNIRIEDFIGATSLNTAEFPDLFVDEDKLATYYLWDSTNCDNPELPCYPFYDLTTGEIIAGAIPEVGYMTRAFGTEPLYLYTSRYGSTPPYYIEPREGTVVAIRYDAGLFRTAHFCFNVMAMDEVSARQVFESMMEWLSYQPFINAGKINSSYFGKDVEKYRNISRNLHALKSRGLLPPM